MNGLALSTGKLCPRCGCQSLEECVPLGDDYNRQDIFSYNKHYNCVALCGMSFGLRIRNNRIEIGYDKENEVYLSKRFNFNPIPDGRKE